MSLLLNGAKTITIAGTEMQCLEIYTGEAYTLPISFTTSTGTPIDTGSWTIDASAKFYNVDNIQYSDLTPDVVGLGNLTLNDPQPTANAYTLVADWSNTTAGTAYLYVGDDITNSGNSTPQVDLANSSANSALVIVTIEVSKASSANASLTDINREPIGFIVRYQ
jgi:hypothetical protein